MTKQTLLLIKQLRKQVDLLTLAELTDNPSLQAELTDNPSLQAELQNLILYLNDYLGMLNPHKKIMVIKDRRDKEK